MQQCFKYFKATVKIYQLLICLVDKFTKHVKRKKKILVISQKYALKRK